MNTRLPVVNLEPLYGNDSKAKQEVGRQIDAICRKSGFFEISNHGIDTATLDMITSETFRFFKSLNEDQKMSMAPKSRNPNNEHIYRGFFPRTLNGKEGFDIGNPDENHEVFKQNLPLNEITQWPPEHIVPGFRRFYQGLFEKFMLLAQVLLKGFALALGKEENFFDEKINYEDTMSTLRLNYYPFLDNIDAVEIAPDGTRLGCEMHRDNSFITILFQPIEGLQVEDDNDGWINVAPSTTNFIINTGKFMSVLSNNVYNAANHRVKFVNVERVSVPFFVEPSYNYLWTPAHPSQIDPQEINHPPISYGGWLKEQLKYRAEYRQIFEKS